MVDQFIESKIAASVQFVVLLPDEKATGLQ
jgi:hypothetical protein